MRSTCALESAITACLVVTPGRLRSYAWRSRSVLPPQTPTAVRLASAAARHSVRAGQPRQIRFARFCAAPCTNSSSGSLPLHAARAVQSVIHMWPHSFGVTPVAGVTLDGVHLRSRPTGADVGPLFRGGSTTYGSPAGMARPQWAAFGETPRAAPGRRGPAGTPKRHGEKSG